MEVDTGASVSVIGKHTYKELWPSKEAPPIESSDVQLQTYTGQPLPVLGTIHVDVGLSLVVLRDMAQASLGMTGFNASTLTGKP